MLRPIELHPEINRYLLVSRSGRSSCAGINIFEGAKYPFDMAYIVAVTGGTGFVALELIKQLLSKGYTVRATVRNQNSVENMAPLKRLGEALPGKVSLIHVPTPLPERLSTIY